MRRNVREGDMRKQRKGSERKARRRSPMEAKVYDASSAELPTLPRRLLSLPYVASFLSFLYIASFLFLSLPLSFFSSLPFPYVFPFFLICLTFSRRLCEEHTTTLHVCVTHNNTMCNSSSVSETLLRCSGSYFGSRSARLLVHLTL